MKKDNKTYDFETTPDLPLKYDRLFFALMVRDPWWGYTCWEIPDEVMDKFRQSFSEDQWQNSKFILRMAELSYSDDFQNAPSFDIVLPEDFKIASWHVNFPGKKSSFQGALGRLTDTEFFPIVFSNIVNVPDPEMSDIVDNTWHINFGDYESFLAQELERIRNVSTKKHSTARDLNIEKDRFYRQKVLRGYVESNFSSGTLVKPGIGVSQLTEEDYARLGEGRGLSSEQVPQMPVGSSEMVQPGGSSESLVRPGSSEAVIKPGGSEQLVRPGASEQLVKPGSSEQFLVPGSSEQLIKPEMQVSPIVEEVLTPGGSEQLVRPGASEQLVKPEVSLVPIVPEEVQKPGGSEQLVRPGASEQLVKPEVTLVPIVPEEVQKPGGSEQLVRPGASEQLVRPVSPIVPIAPKEIVKPGGSEQLVRPGASEQLVRPGASEQIIRPGGSEQLVRPGGSEQLIRPGASEHMIRPGSSESMIKPGSSGLVNNTTGDSPVPGLYEEPEESHWIACSYEVTIYGNTSPGSTLTFEGDEIPVSEDGRFSVRIAMPSDTQEIEFLSISPDGERRVIRTCISRADQKVEI